MPSSVRQFLLDYLERYYDIANGALLTQALEPSAMPAMGGVSTDDIHKFLRAVGAHKGEVESDPKVWDAFAWCAINHDLGMFARVSSITSIACACFERYCAPLCQRALILFRMGSHNHSTHCAKNLPLSMVSPRNKQALLHTFVARSCLSYELALRVNEAVDAMLAQTTSDDFVDERQVLEETFAEDVSLSYPRWFLYRFLNFLRLLYMSLTADPRFGRELHFGKATPAVLCHMLPPVYGLARRINLGLSMALLWRSDRGVWGFVCVHVRMRECSPTSARG